MFKKGFKYILKRVLNIFKGGYKYICRNKGIMYLLPVLTWLSKRESESADNL